MTEAGTKIQRSNNWINGLDSIRFVLALIVFLSHLQNYPAIYLKSFDSTFFKWIGIAVNHLFLGPGAVIAFFIISGFVIHYPLKQKPLDVKTFLIRRWLRISLPLIVVVLISVYFDMFGYIPIWSLYCELIYYTIYPFLRRSGISWKIQFLISFVIALVVIVTSAGGEISSMLALENINYSGSYAATGDLLTWIVGLPCWLLGVIIAENIDSKNEIVSMVKINIIRGVVLFVAMIIVGLKAHLFISYIITLNFYALLLAYWLEKEIIFFRNRAAIPLLEYGGKFSYSLYLLHALSITFLAMILDLNIATYFLYIFLSLLIAFLFYKLVEEPSHRLSKYMAELAKTSKGHSQKI